MAGKALLDTNVVIAMLNRDSRIKAIVDSYEEVFVPSIVVGELYLGALRSQRIIENVSRIESYCRDCVILEVDEQTGRRYGEVKAQLMAAGKPIPQNDVWIAAIALQYEIPLLTRDKDFKSVESLEAIYL